MNNEFKIDLGIQLNEGDFSKIKQKIKSLEDEKINIKIDFGDTKTQFSSIGKQMRQTGVNAGNDFAKGFNNGMNSIKATVSNTEGVIKGIKNSLAGMKVDSSSIDNVTKDLKEMNLEITKATAKINGNKLNVQVQGIDELKRTVNIVKQFDYESGKITSAGKIIGKTISQSFDTAADAAKKFKKEADAATNLQLKGRGLFSDIDKWLKDNSAAAKEFGARLRDIQAKIQTADEQDLKNLRAEFANIKKEADIAGKSTQKLGDRLRGQFEKYSIYFSAASTIMYATQALRNMFDQVVAIDTAMTELKKVTDETNATYNNFLSEAAGRASEIGTTIDGLVTSTADFARLGYEFADAANLAEVANIYTVVGDEIDSVDTATQSVISTMKAFKVETSDSMSIVDKFNEVSNNFAISSGGIGEALTRSASSLAAANNDLDESVALITAAM